MPWTVDARIPVRLGTAAELRSDDAVLFEGSVTVPPNQPWERFDVAIDGHPAGCSCCITRSGAAVALDRLFQRRARGEAMFFRRVLAVTTGQTGEVAVWSALRDDPLVAARFRREGP